jgi:hypothetical protein
VSGAANAVLFQLEEAYMRFGTNVMLVRRGAMKWELLFVLLAFCLFSPAVMAQEICICGYAAGTYCDGSMEHYISECYTENDQFRGYDDQLIGECPAITPLRRTDLGKYTVSKSQLPQALQKLIRDKQIKR